jgi:ribonuclease BN (tRNA processing enzyme)
VDPGQYLISYLVNDTLAIDCGSLGFYGTPQMHARIKHILITHTHADHTASLPIFLENAYEGKADCVTIHGSDAVLEGLQKDMFNDRTWPDFVAFSVGSKAPFVKLSRLEAYKPVELEGLTITPVPMDHVVPTLGFVVTEGPTTVVVASDTGPTEAIWKVANQVPNLAAVFLETSFPESMLDLARRSAHLTPALFAAEVKKLTRPVPVLVIHIKARFRRQVIAELSALKLPNVEVARFGHAYEW